MRCQLQPTLKLGTLLAAASFALSGPSYAAESSPLLSYWHVWTDAQGSTHQTRCQLRDFVLKSIEPPASPQWLKRLQAKGAEVIFTELPVGWQGTWHENPKPQWIIPLSGRWYVETLDGKRTEMGPGDISFGEDQGTKADARGRRGHFSGTVGDEPATLLIIQLKETPTAEKACHFQ